MCEENILELIGNVAFPILMCVFLMIRFDKTVNKLTETVQKLIDRIDKNNG